MDLETPITTQEQLDSIIKERLERKEQSVKERYADYDELKQKALELDEVQKSSRNKLEKALSEQKELRAQLEALEKSNQLSALVQKASDEYKVPAALIKGTTEEEINEHAKALADYKKSSSAATLPYLGQAESSTPTSKVQAFSDVFEQAFSVQ